MTLSFWNVVLRLFVAAICGGLIGIDRGRKRRAAGFRTHMLVCMGAALTIVLGIYLSNQIYGVWGLGDFYKTDISRFGAQVINGIGFIGAGTIIVTGRQQVKGMTTAAGLWASACMGLAIGAGFWAAAVIGCSCIIITIVIFSKLESFILSHSRNVNIFVEFENADDLSTIIERIKEQDVRIFDIELTKAKGESYPNAIFSLQLPKSRSHAYVMTAIAEIDTVRTIEEV
ncbi:MAG: MgtC/SapB family protein [Ruminococcaceae bacterium]|nr:MgtC/SapB family protein [Oscillospiraceae bacterium]